MQGTIRRATIKDASAVHAVLLSGRDDIPLAANFADDAHKQWVRDQCRQHNVWLCEYADALAGVMVMAVDEIFYLVTAPAYRKRGVAQALVEDATARVWKRYREPARGRAREANRPVVQLLEKLGFKADYDRVTQPGWVVYAAMAPRLAERGRPRRTPTRPGRPRQHDKI
jgi:GNAT superfamily N-acetyltransferase